MAFAVSIYMQISAIASGLTRGFLIVSAVMRSGTPSVALTVSKLYIR